MMNGILCPICQSNINRRIFSSPYFSPLSDVLKKINYEICFICGAVFPFPKPSEYQIGLYYKHHPDVSEPNHAKRGDQVFNFLKKNAEIKGRKILDIGCGDGYLMSLLRGEGGLVVGVEPSDKRRLVCSDKKLKAHESVSCLDSKERFDIIIMTDVLEHLLNPGAMFQSVKKLLKPDGLFYVDIPDVLGKGFVSDLFFPHLCHYSAKNIKLFLERKGFHILFRSEYDMGTTFLKMFISRTGKSRFEKNKNLSELTDNAKAIERHIISQIDGVNDYLFRASLNLRQAMLGKGGAVLAVYPCGLQTQMLLQNYFDRLPSDIILLDRNPAVQKKKAAGICVEPPEILSSLKKPVYMLFSSMDMNTNKALHSYAEKMCPNPFEYRYLFFD